MTLTEVMGRLESLGNEKMRAINAKNGVGSNQFGVKMGDIRAIAKEIKINPALAKELWATGCFDAKQLAILLLNPKKLTSDEVEELVRTAEYAYVADWLMTNIVKAHAGKEALRVRWMSDSDSFAARAGWSLTTEKVIKDPSGLDFAALLDRIEAEMGAANELVQWTMNFCLMEIGINHPDFRDRAIAIGEKLGLYSDWPVHKGCIPPYAPVAIRELAARKG